MGAIATGHPAVAGLAAVPAQPSLGGHDKEKGGQREGTPASTTLSPHRKSIERPRSGGEPSRRPRARRRSSQRHRDNYTTGTRAAPHPRPRRSPTRATDDSRGTVRSTNLRDHGDLYAQGRENRRSRTRLAQKFRKGLTAEGWGVGGGGNAGSTSLAERCGSWRGLEHSSAAHGRCVDDGGTEGPGRKTGTCVRSRQTRRREKE